MENLRSETISDNVTVMKGKKRQRLASQKLKVITQPAEKGKPKKWRQRGRRPPPTSGGAASPVLSTFRLFNTDVEYRVCGTIVMFSTENMLSLTKTSLGLKTDVAKSTPVGAVLRHLRTASKYELLLQASIFFFETSYWQGFKTKSSQHANANMRVIVVCSHFQTRNFWKKGLLLTFKVYQASYTTTRLQKNKTRPQRIGNI